MDISNITSKSQHNDKKTLPWVEFLLYRQISYYSRCNKVNKSLVDNGKTIGNRDRL